MYNSNQNSTSLGLPEVVERVGAYLLLWVSGLLLLLFEKNPNVRFHARQSLLVFGTLSVLSLAINVLHWVLGWVPLVGGLIALAGSLVWAVTVILWLFLMLMAAISPRFRMPGVQRIEKLLS